MAIIIVIIIIMSSFYEDNIFSTTTNFKYGPRLENKHENHNTIFTGHYVKVSVLIKFLQKTSVFTLIIVSSP